MMETEFRTGLKYAMLFGAVVLVPIIALYWAASSASSWMPVENTDYHGSFWWGFLHGSTIMFAWIVSWFKDGITIYQWPNNGGFYNFGFMLGIWVFGVSGAQVIRSRR